MRSFAPLVAVVALVAAPSADALAQRATPIRFARGGTSAQLDGVLYGGRPQLFTLDARAGQTIRLKTTPAAYGSDALLGLRDARGRNVALDMGDDGWIQARLPRTGRYTVRVWQAAEGRVPRNDYVLNVAIVGGR